MPDHPLLKLEAEHRRLVKKYFQADISDSTQYHLVVNTALIKPETIIGIVNSLIINDQTKETTL